MAINIPILTEFDSKGLQSAQGAFNNFRSKVNEADGAMGKFKAGGTAALDAIKANAGVMALGAGAAIAGFALKAISQFQDLALEVDKFSNATGLAAEQSSKWIEVAGDIGVESGTLLTAFNRMNKAIGDNSKAFQDLGVEIVRTSSGATDVNATFLNTVEALRNIEDPAERARLATQILGKSWTELSELVEMGAGSLKSALDDVAGAKVIDEKEIQKAKDLRAAQDALGDAFDEFVLTVGQELTPALTNATKAAGGLLDVIAPLTGAVLGQVEADASYGEQISQNNVSLRIAATAWEWLSKKLGMVSDEAEENAEVTAEMTAAWKGGYRAMIDARTASENLTRALKNSLPTAAQVEEQWAKLLGTLSDQEAWNNLLDSLDATKSASYEALVQGTAESARRAQNEMGRLTRDVYEYVQGLGNIPPNVQSKIIAALDRGAFDEAIALLENIRRGAVAPITGTVGGIPVGPGETPSEVRPPGFRPPASIKQPKIPIGGPGGAGKYSAVTVNVGGSVISEGDLVERVRQGLVNAQRNGSGLVYTNR